MATTILGARPVLGSRDLDASKRFWTDALGFAVHVERDAYVLLRAGEGEVALEADDRPTAAGVVLRVMGIDDLHRKCSAATAGQRVTDVQTRDSGRRDFTVEDPDGHRITLVEMPRRGGRIGWVDLTVEDASGARDFWAAVADFDGIEAVPMGGWSDFVLTSDGRQVAGICHARGFNAGLPPAWMVTFAVGDLARAVSEVGRRGGTVLEQRGSMAVVRDPSGAIAALWVP